MGGICIQAHLYNQLTATIQNEKGHSTYKFVKCGGMPCHSKFIILVGVGKAI